MNPLESLWSLVLHGSLRATLLIVCIWGLRALLRGRVPAQCFHLLWVLVAVRLLLPVLPDSSWSVFNLFVRADSMLPAAAEPWRLRFDPVAEPIQGAKIAAASPVAALPASRAEAWPWWAMVWLAGIGCQVILLGYSAVRMRQRLARIPELPARPRLLSLAAECARHFGLSGRLAIVESAAVAGPAVLGLWRPRVLLPPGLAEQLSDEELRLVLLHECAHLRRRDLPALWLLTAARLVHWFNPLVWLAVRTARTDAELACDETVLRRSATIEPKAYGEALLKLAQLVAWKRSALPLAGIVEGRGAIRVRVTRIAQFTRAGRRHFWLPLLAVLGAGVLFGADENSTPNRKTSAPVSPVGQNAPPKTAAAAGEVPAPTPEPTPDWVKGWSILWVSFSPDGEPDKAQVDFQMPGGQSATLLVGGRTDQGIQLEAVAELADRSGPAHKVAVTLSKGAETAVLYAASNIVSRRGMEQPAKVQVEIEGRYIELSETTARRMSGPVQFIPGVDRTGLDLLCAPRNERPEPTVLTAAQVSDLLKVLQSQKGVDFISAPRVTTKVGQRAVIEIIREFRYPVEWDWTTGAKEGWNPKRFETRNTGLTLEVEPTANDAGAITLRTKPQVVEFLGFHNLDTKKNFPTRGTTVKSLSDRALSIPGASQDVKKGAWERLKPVFSARSVDTTVTLLSGHSVLLVGLAEQENEEALPSRAKTHRLAVLLTARWINPDGRPLKPK